MIPERIKMAMDYHVSRGQACGGFVTAVLENDLCGALFMADSESFAAMLEIARYLYNEMPEPCWGSKEKVQQWRDKGGLNAKLRCLGNDEK